MISLGLLVDDDNLRVQVFLVLDDDRALHAGLGIELLLDGHARDHVAELHLARLLGENRDIVRIPLHEGFALLDMPAVGDRDGRTDHDLVALDFAAVFAMDGDGTVLVEHDPLVLGGMHRLEVVITDFAIVLGLDDRLLERARRRATQVERPHGKLRAGFADGLGGDDADRFAELDHLAGGQVAGRSTWRRRHASIRRSARSGS